MVVIKVVQITYFLRPAIDDPFENVKI